MKQKLSIAIILPTIITKNGTAKQSLELAKKLSQKGHQVTFITYAYASESAFPEFNKFPVISCVKSRSALLFKIIKNIGLLENIYLYLGLINIHKLRKMIYARNDDILNTHDWFGIWVCGSGNNNAKLIANINDVPQRNTGTLIDRIKLAFDKKYAKKIKAIIVLDNQNKEKIKKWIPFDDKKIHVVRSGIDLTTYQQFKEEFDFRKTFNLSKNSIIISCANLLAPNRKYEDIINAMSLIDLNKYNINLFILSRIDYNIKYASFLRELIKTKQLTNHVHFVDKFFTDKERMLYIQNTDMLVFPNYPQTWGLTVIEAMALGVPVIVSYGSGVSEVLKDGKTALLYQPGDVQTLKKKIEYAVTNKLKMKQIASNGKEFVSKSFSWDKFTDQIEKIMLS